MKIIKKAMIENNPRYKILELKGINYVKIHRPRAFREIWLHKLRFPRFKGEKSTGLYFISELM